MSDRTEGGQSSSVRATHLHKGHIRARHRAVCPRRQVCVTRGKVRWVGW